MKDVIYAFVSNKQKVGFKIFSDKTQEMIIDELYQKTSVYTSDGNLSEDHLAKQNKRFIDRKCSNNSDDACIKEKVLFIKDREKM